MASSPQQNNRVVYILLAVVALVAVAYGIYNMLSKNTSDTAGAQSTGQSVIAGDPHSSASPTQPESSPSATAVVEASPSPSYTGGPVLSPNDHPQAPSVTTEYEPVAEGFARAWGNTKGGKDAWLERIKPYASQELYEGLQRTNFDVYIKEMSYDRVEVDTKEVSVYVISAFYDGKKEASLKMFLEPTGENFQYQVTETSD